MAQSATLLNGPWRSKANRGPVPAVVAAGQRRPLVHLFFPLDAMFLRTPFRAQVLRLIHEIAVRELDNRIASVEVQASADPDASGRFRLLLTIWADVDKHQWRAADKAISEAMFEQESNWTEEEMADYLKMIDFEVMPLNI